MNEQTKIKSSVFGRKGLLAMLALSLALLFSACADETVSEKAAKATAPKPLPFYEPFANNQQLWILGPEWEIGSAQTHIPTNGKSDPGTDVTPTADNGIAGVVIGGEYDISGGTHPFYYLTSPPIDASPVAGTLTFSFYRWLNSDYAPYVENVVEVFDGSTWVTPPLFNTGGGSYTDIAWSFMTYDITAYANPNLKVRFGFDIGDPIVIKYGGWNVDDVKIEDL